MTWTTTIMAYLIIGLLIGELAQYGHRVKFGGPMPLKMWITGTLLWPLVVVVGFMK